MTRSFFDLPVLEYSPAWALTSAEERKFSRPNDRPDGPQSLAELSPYLLYATKTTEFSKQAQTLRLEKVLVGRGRAWVGDEAGLCYTADEYPELSPNSILVINPDVMLAHLSLVDMFLHEAAHIFTNGEWHTWTFLVMLNVMRLRCGLGPSIDPYDWRDVRHSPELALLSLPDSTIQSSGADVGHFLFQLLYGLGPLRFLIQDIWDKVASEAVTMDENVDFAELCRSTARGDSYK
jgi:hypothetical protein